MLDTLKKQQATSQPCWWMLAGIVDYKLCDRNFDCEHCPFDLILQSGSKFEQKSADAQLIDSAFYSPAHVWVRVEDRGNVRIGLDDFVQKLLGRMYAVSLPHEGLRLDKGQHCWSVTHKQGETALVVPLSGTILEVNWKLKQSPSLLNRDPYGAGWVLVIKPTDLRTGLRDLFYGSRAVAWHRAEMEKLQSLTLEISGRAMGTSTLPDGGMLKKDFLSELSAEQMRELIDSLLPCPRLKQKPSDRHSRISCLKGR